MARGTFAGRRSCTGTGPLLCQILISWSAAEAINPNELSVGGSLPSTIGVMQIARRALLIGCFFSDSSIHGPAS